MCAWGAMRRRPYPSAGPAHDAGGTTIALAVRESAAALSQGVRQKGSARAVGAAGRRGDEVEVLR